MEFDKETKKQLQEYLGLLESDICIQVSLDTSEHSSKIEKFIQEVAQLSNRITVEHAALERTPSFMINQVGKSPSGVSFAGVPGGHEFTSFILAILQVSGRKPKVDEKIIEQIKSIETPLVFETFISLSCHNCPDVVQALNVMSVVNPLISNTMIDGAMFQEEAERRSIMAVPTVYLNGEEFCNGRTSIEEILSKLVDASQEEQEISNELYDVLVVGGGPAGASAAIYSARKGIKTGLIAKTLGGQVMDTLGIENVIGIPYIEGPKLMSDVENHMAQYPIDIMKGQNVQNIKANEHFELTLENGSVVRSKTAIVATGARWRNINVPGEHEFKNKGVAYCPHCDGPFFKGKNVAVIGGGNSGIEAAIDLAGIVNHVTVIEFQSTLKADEVLQKRLYSLGNVTVITDAKTTEISGEDKVAGLSYLDMKTNTEQTIAVEGVFILVGLVPNTEWLEDTITKTAMKEIVVDKKGATNIPGLFAAGDCTDSAYKQIIISMGSGATAALGAFDWIIRN